MASARRGGAAAAVRTDMVRNARGRPGANELRVLPTRYWARGRGRHEFAWMRELSPSAGLLGRYKRGEIGWAGFAAAYAAQLASDPSARAAVGRLHDAAASGERTVVLYCYEEPGRPCHRHILRGMVATGRICESAAACARFEDGRAAVAAKPRRLSRGGRRR